jgi:hypothetical protein
MRFSLFFGCLALATLVSPALGRTRSLGSTAPRDFYQIKTYLYSSPEQGRILDHYLEFALLPALHRAGISPVGVFRPLGDDTATLHRICLLIPFRSFQEYLGLTHILDGDRQYQADGRDYLDAEYKHPPYLRFESVLLQAFEDMPIPAIPALKSPKSERIFELRSYEGATEKIHQNKVRMFNQGGEIPLFSRLGFNAVFYAEVISGGHMPNLMYMTSFEDSTAHDQHWKQFGTDPQWKKLSSAPEYQNNVSHIDILLMHPAPYSDL